MKRIYILFIAFGIAFSACEDRFTQVVEIEIPDHEPKLVAYCFIDTNNDSVFVEVSKSQQIMQDIDPYILNAEIQLSDGSQLISDQFELTKHFTGIDYSTPQMDSIFAYNYVTKTGTFFSTGTEYMLDIKAPGLPSITASCTIPGPVEISSVEVQKDGIIDPDGFTSDEIKIRFKDPGNETNYYIMAANSIHKFDGFEYKNQVYLNPVDPRIRESSWRTIIIPGTEEYVYFNDKEGIDWNENVFSFSTYLYESSEDEEVELYVKLYSISKEVYDFCHAYNQYKDSEDVFFAEPVTIPSNFDNGFGVFGAYDYTQIKIDL